jgi:hypothetical protein
MKKVPMTKKGKPDKRYVKSLKSPSKVTKKAPTKRTVKRRVKNVRKGYYPNPLEGVVYWDGGYISTGDRGIKGKHLALQRKLKAAVKRGDDTVTTSAGDELPISYKGYKKNPIGKTAIFAVAVSVGGATGYLSKLSPLRFNDDAAKALKMTQAGALGQIDKLEAKFKTKFRAVRLGSKKP